MAEDNKLSHYILPLPQTSTLYLRISKLIILSTSDKNLVWKNAPLALLVCHQIALFYVLNYFCDINCVKMAARRSFLFYFAVILGECSIGIMVKKSQKVPSINYILYLPLFLNHLNIYNVYLGIIKHFNKETPFCVLYVLWSFKLMVLKWN